MTQPRSRSLIAAVLLLAATVDVADAQTVANGPYYATPSWDQTLPGATRFVVLSNFSNQAVLDRETGLVWERSPSTFANTYDIAFTTCALSDRAGRTGWRLPSIHELTSLFEYSNVGNAPPFPAGHPFAVPAPTNFGVLYWSTTSGTILSDGNKFVIGYSLSPGNTIARSSGRLLQTQSATPWCVRASGDAGTAR